MHLTVYSEKALTTGSQDHTASDIFPGVSQGVSYICNAVFGLTHFSLCPTSFTKQAGCLE